MLFDILTNNIDSNEGASNSIRNCLNINKIKFVTKNTIKLLIIYNKL